MKRLTLEEEKLIARHIARSEIKLLHVFPTSEGGFGQRLALELLRGEGILAVPAPAFPAGVYVFGCSRIQKKAEQILLNY